MAVLDKTCGEGRRGAEAGGHEAGTDEQFFIVVHGLSYDPAGTALPVAHADGDDLVVIVGGAGCFGRGGVFSLWLNTRG
ncbi:hypothetical protein D3C80_2112620 [compost metagenome]